MGPVIQFSVHVTEQYMYIRSTVFPLEKSSLKYLKQDYMYLIKTFTMYFKNPLLKKLTTKVFMTGTALRVPL